MAWHARSHAQFPWARMADCACTMCTQQCEISEHIVRIFVATSESRLTADRLAVAASHQESASQGPGPAASIEQAGEGLEADRAHGRASHHQVERGRAERYAAGTQPTTGPGPVAEGRALGGESGVTHVGRTRQPEDAEAARAEAAAALPGGSADARLQLGMRLEDQGMGAQSLLLIQA